MTRDAPGELADILARLARLHPKVIDLSLGRIERLVAALGHPEQHLPPVVHVAGTNGKGSVLAFLRAMLEAAGQRVHVYTSPHLVRFNERFRLAGEIVDDATLIDALRRTEATNDGHPITFFEITTAAAFLMFREHAADIVLLETGLGGRLDATNLIARPAAVAITPVSIDHTQFLGNTLEEIAGEKAGILKPGMPAVIARQDPVAAAVIEARARDIDAPLFRADIEWRATAPTAQALTWQYEDAAGQLVLPQPRLPGAHQTENAACAVALARRLPAPGLPAGAIADGLRRADWPARLQRLTRGPLAGLMTETGGELWLDGGHNPAAGRVLADSFCAMAPAPLYLVFAMLSVKDPVGFLTPFAGLAEGVIQIPLPPDHEPVPDARTRAVCHDLGLRFETAPDSRAAVRAVTGRARAPRVLITGSLYLAGDVLRDNS